MSTEFEPKHLLTAPFYVSLSLLSRKRFLKVYKSAGAFRVYEPERMPRSKILDLYFFTTTYAAWAAYTFGIITSKNPWDNLDLVANFVTSHRGPVVTADILRNAFESYADTTRSLLRLWVQKPQVSVEDLKDSDDCWECCYEDPECRIKYDGDEMECFERCTAGSLE